MPLRKGAGGGKAVPLRKKELFKKKFFFDGEVPIAIKHHYGLNGTTIKKNNFFCGFPNGMDKYRVCSPGKV